MKKKSQTDIVEGDDQHWYKVVKYKLAQDHLVVMLMDCWKAEGEVFQTLAQALFGGKNSQWQADEEAEGPDQDKHEDDQVHRGRLVWVGDDHGARHGHGTQ